MDNTSNNQYPYQRAVTPSIDGPNGLVRGKMLSYQARRNRTEIPNSSRSSASQTSQQRILYRGPAAGMPGPADMNIQGRSAVGGRGMLLNGSRPDIYGMGFRFLDHDSREQLTTTSILPRHDLIPLSEEIPQDGVIFTRVRNHPEMLVVFRTPEERTRNPERLNLDRRQLDICPLLEQEQRLRLLNFQNNNIRCIQNLENLPNLIFLDLYNNKLTSLDGPLSAVSGLRVLMAGKNRINTISNLSNLKKLDVLDLHSNDIREVEGLNGLGDLRVLNLAGNRLSVVKNLSSLQSLTELNLRRNCIQKLIDLDKIPTLQRVFLSHNLIVSLEDMQCLFNIRYLIELSLDGNPISDADPIIYRKQIIAGLNGLRHLDLRRVTDEERVLAHKAFNMDNSSSARIADSSNPHSSSTNNPLYSSTTSLTSGGGGPGTTGSTGREAFGTTDLDGTQSVGSTSMAASTSGAGGVGKRSTGHRNLPNSSSTTSLILEKEKEFANSTNNFNNRNISPDNVSHHSPFIASPTPTSNNNNATTTHTTNPVVAYNQERPASSSSLFGSLSQSLQTNNNNYNNDKSVFSPNNISRSVSKMLGTRSMFELEVTGPNEKSLVVVGELWDWVQSKRMLATVSIASLEHMKKEVIMGKFACNLSWLPALKTLKLAYNDFDNFDDIRRLGEAFTTIETLRMRESPVCSLSLYRSYTICYFPQLKILNDIVITTEERVKAQYLMRPILKAKELIAANNAAAQGSSSNAGGASKEGKASGESGNGKDMLTESGKGGMTVTVSSGGAEDGTKIYQNMKALALQRRESLEVFDEAFKRAVQRIISETVKSIQDFELR